MAKKKKPETMYPFLAVFNQRRSDVAFIRRKFNQHFGAGSWKRLMAPIMREGIMVIYQRPQTPHTRWYSDEMTKRVNARNGADPWVPEQEHTTNQEEE